jgi:hypothetical protein
MKKLIYILMFFFPVVVCAQQPWVRSSPVDYAWKNVGNAGFSAGDAWYTSLQVSPSGEPYVAYGDWGNLAKASVMKFDGINWVNVGYSGFSSGQIFYTSLAFSPTDGYPYVAYSDLSYSYKSTVMKFDGNNWVNVGNAGFSVAEASYTDLAFSPSDGQSYVAYCAAADTGKATLMKFDGTNWVDVGKAGFSKGITSYLNLAFSPLDGQPYVAYCDEADSGKATVMKFDGTNWVNVGNEGFSAGGIAFTSLAFSPSGQPYMAYQDAAYSGKATVMKFDGINWIKVGNEGFSAGYVMGTSLAFSPSDGQPYVSYSDWVTNPNGKATVMKFDGTNWVEVGTAGFSAGQAVSTSIAFSLSGQPYVAYQDVGNSQKATVMKFDSVFVGINEQQESRFSLYPNPVTEKITIETSGTANGSNLAIENIEGQELITRQISEPKTVIDISAMPCGVYFVRLTGERTVGVGKFIKQ